MPQAYHIALPDHLRGTVTLPASKSISARALIIAALAGNAQLENLSDCDDTTVLRRALAEAFARNRHPRRRHRHAFSERPSSPSRLASISSPAQHACNNAPIRLLVSALKTLGADISYVGAEGFPPLRICGRHWKGAVSASLPT